MLQTCHIAPPLAILREKRLAHAEHEFSKFHLFNTKKTTTMKTTHKPAFAALPPPLRSFGVTSRRGRQNLIAATLAALTTRVKTPD
jgi:hypothetical protein